MKHIKKFESSKNDHRQRIIDNIVQKLDNLGTAYLSHIDDIVSEYAEYSEQQLALSNLWSILKKLDLNDSELCGEIEDVMVIKSDFNLFDKWHDQYSLDEDEFDDLINHPERLEPPKTMYEVVYKIAQLVGDKEMTDRYGSKVEGNKLGLL